MKAGDVVQVVNLKDCPERVTTKIEEGDILIVREVKDTGGLVFEDIVIGYNLYGEEQGLVPSRVKRITNPTKNPVIRAVLTNRKVAS